MSACVQRDRGKSGGGTDKLIEGRKENNHGMHTYIYKHAERLFIVSCVLIIAYNYRVYIYVYTVACWRSFQCSLIKG